MCRGSVGRAWEWEGLFEWLGIWGCGMELWAGSGSGRGYLNAWEFVDRDWLECEGMWEWGWPLDGWEMRAWLALVGGAWEWERLFEWLGIWRRGMELWVGSGRSFLNGWEFGGGAWSAAGSGRGLGMDEKWGRGLQLWAGPESGRGFLNGWEFGGGAWRAAGCGSGSGSGRGVGVGRGLTGGAGPEGRVGGCKRGRGLKEGGA